MIGLTVFRPSVIEAVLYIAHLDFTLTYNLIYCAAITELHY